MKIFNKYYIDFKSFFKKGIKCKDSPFGVFIITGRMGTGKTYFAVKFASEYNHKVKTNIQSLKIPNLKIEYFSQLSEIYNDTEENLIYIIDEVGKKYTKDSKPDKDFYNFLQMSRKTKRVVFLIHQEYLQVPNWLRGPIQEIYTTHKIRFLPFLYITYRGTPLMNTETLEWVVDYNSLYIYKRIKNVANYYDTFETYNTL